MKNIYREFSFDDSNLYNILLTFFGENFEKKSAQVL